MDTRRIVLALVVALALAGGAAYFFAARLKQSGPNIQIIKVVATAKELPPGIVLKAEDLSLVDWPSTVPLEGSFSKPDEVVGRSLMYPLGAKEPVLARALALAGSGFGLTAKIPSGMRATSVRSSEITGVAGFLFPGSHVDVLATFRPTGSDSPVTQTVLQDVEVLTAGQRIQPDPEGKPQTVNVVTLLLNSLDSEKLLLASTQATIQFVLRGGADKDRIETRSVNMEDLFAGIKKPPAPAPAAAHRARREAPKVASR